MVQINNYTKIEPINEYHVGEVIKNNDCVKPVV